MLISHKIIIKFWASLLSPNSRNVPLGICLARNTVYHTNTILNTLLKDRNVLGFMHTAYQKFHCEMGNFQVHMVKTI